MLCNEVQPLALPLGELSPQVTERVVQSFLNDEINLYAHTTKIHLAWPLFPLSVFAALSHLSQRERQGMPAQNQMMQEQAQRMIPLCLLSVLFGHPFRRAVRFIR